MLQICRDFIQGNKDSVKWHDGYKVPYIYKGDVWVSYDNEYSLQKKVSFLLMQAEPHTVLVHNHFTVLMQHIHCQDEDTICQRHIILSDTTGAVDDGRATWWLDGVESRP